MFYNYQPRRQVYSQSRPVYPAAPRYTTPFDDEPTMDAATYRDLAIEHQRRANLAMALAEEREQQELQQRNSRMMAIERLRHELAELEAQEGRHRHQYNPYRRPTQTGFCSTAQPRRVPMASPRLRAATRPHQGCGAASSFGPRSQDQVPEPLDAFAAFFAQLLNAGQDEEASETAPKDATPTAVPRHQVSFATPEHTSEATPAKVDKGKAPETPRSDFTNRIRNALNETRTEDEKDAIMRALKLVGRQTTTPAAPSQAPVEIASNGNQQSPASSPSHTRTSSLSSIDAIQAQFDILKSSFVFPSALEFLSSPSEGGPKLAYTAVNAPVNAYEAGLTKLLTKLDSVESNGLESVRGARKALVLAVEAELDALEVKKTEAWEKTHVKDEGSAILPAEVGRIEIPAEVEVVEAIAYQEEDTIVPQNLSEENGSPTLAPSVALPLNAAAVIAPNTADAEVLESVADSDTIIQDAASATSEGGNRYHDAEADKEVSAVLDQSQTEASVAQDEDATGGYHVEFPTRASTPSIHSDSDFTSSPKSHKVTVEEVIDEDDAHSDFEVV